MKVKKIFLVSGKARSGKDLFCKLYQENGLANSIAVDRFAFADDLKVIAKKFGWNETKQGEGRDFLIDVGQILRGDYELSYGVLMSKITGKKVLRVSYDAVRLYINLLESYTPHKDFWVDLVIEKIVNSPAKIVIIPDWRFENELSRLKAYFKKKWFSPKIYTIRIDNKRSLLLDDPSETGLDNLTFDFVIDNNLSLDTFRYTVSKFFEKQELPFWVKGNFVV